MAATPTNGEPSSLSVSPCSKLSPSLFNLRAHGITFDHYMALLQFDLNSPVLSNWQAFAQEFLSKFGMFDTVAEAKDNLFNLWMCNNKWFTTFIICFEKEAYKIGWNYNALQFALCCALPQRIKDVLHLTPKQPIYNGYKVLITQIDQQYWEDHSAIGNQTTSAAPPPNSTAQLPLEQGLANTNQPLEPCPPAQLNITNLQEALDPNQTNNNLPQDPHDIPDLVDDKVALCMSRFRNWPWIDVLEEMQEQQQSMLAATPQRLPIPIHLILFNGSSTSAGDITHYMQITLTFANELQLFNGKPTTTGPIIKKHCSSIVLNNVLWFLVDFLVTQLLGTTSIMLGLLWLCNINPNIDWRDLTMKFPNTSACLATVHLCLQPTDIFSEARAISAMTALSGNSGDLFPP
ncbi:hypothetical protein C0993_000297 [Termitomyces sp. T159_Od127]|nr:hypothetical protein C0993_000297 [Termitomyces sp. T159_Od127]